MKTFLSSRIPNLRKMIYLFFSLSYSTQVHHQLTCIVTRRSSICISFVKKSAPIVALYWFENLRETNCPIRLVFPTPLSPNQIHQLTTIISSIRIYLKWSLSVRLSFVQPFEIFQPKIVNLKFRKQSLEWQQHTNKKTRQILCPFFYYQCIVCSRFAHLFVEISGLSQLISHE